MSVDIARVTTALKGRYEIQRELGRGGMATVFLAEDPRLGRRVAMLYLMNYFKNTRTRPADVDNRGYFALEQVSASLVIFCAMGLLWWGARSWGWADPRVVLAHEAIDRPSVAAIASGAPYGLVAFFSVFLFMFEGRTATFAGLVNRLTSLLAGTASTLALMWFFHLRPPAVTDWVSFAFIMVAVVFLARAEQRRTAEAAG